MNVDQQRMAAWNSTSQPYLRDRCVQDLVHARAIETPAALAVAAGDRKLTYEELETLANRLACELCALGAGPEAIVGLCANRSPEMIVGALAILKAGAAYLPLDPSYPADRLAFVLGDASCRLLLCAPGVASSVTAKAEKVVAIDLDGSRSAEPPTIARAADHLAYVIYTSGSTGQPKGVEITHDSLLNLVFWHQRTFQISRTERATQIASVGFDAAVWELWPYLTAGASVHLPDEGVRGEPVALRDWLLAQQISIAFVPTPMAERLLLLEWPRDAPLRVMLTGGDTLHHHPSSELPFVVVNNYGPTESTVVATSGVVPPRGDAAQRPSIGRPIDNTQIYILDEHLRQVPIGMAGEVHIGGAGLARGYLNRPELTADKFVPNPFGADSGARLYKTGDLARHLPDGQIAFLGRIDDQIKIRGFRIEPNEIVSALNQHPDVVSSAVLAGDLCSGERRLVAYVVTRAGSRPTVGDLQGALRTQLPEYMVPAVFIALDSLPLGPHGKIDRTALPEPTPNNMLRDADFEEPRTDVEKRVAELVLPLLGLEQVSTDDNFFLLGGHSLMGTQLAGRIRDVFGIELSLRSIFDAPTVALLAGEIERRLVEKLETMTEEEADRLLSEHREVV